ncbi:hypothetical protein Tsubulata_019289 [Turnera subulata]|uniref:Ribosomal RNA-processing protein 7 C-terminal domain-containing protein n=1 Tax=Turnera subulata TaxID=218843 RepID=A0A9Q0J294_9ROSI|nr:hypothetical protein Tsubulata_019289 [Turnera subulata]
MGKVKQRLDENKKLKTKKAAESDDRMLENVREENEKNKPTMKQKKKRERTNNYEGGLAAEISKDNKLCNSGEKKKRKTKNRRKNEEKYNDVVGNSDQLDSEAETGFTESDVNREAVQDITTTHKGNKKFRGQSEAGIETMIKTRKSKKSERKGKGQSMSNVDEKRGEANQDDVYFISSGDDDCAKGIKKWLTEYHKARPGLKVLQQRIDEFITDHEEKLEQQRKEREALAAEGGWTVVTHHKGRKKTTDSETGVTVGSVAQAAVEDKMSKKKSKEVGPDFYRFQRRDAQRSEILALREKFEQDKKRLQQLRAARKFRPY